MLDVAAIELFYVMYIAGLSSYYQKSQQVMCNVYTYKVFLILDLCTINEQVSNVLYVGLTTVRVSSDLSSFRGQV